ncbi:integral membrane protein [Bordetella ansorpii]|uniref:Integral membrane protein n=1 Tax=Bordetella ansorpii TaxID=288768 RepID=A0A157RGE8_9BORD|nr:hypothetical protein [Bordetella ansorpii]SAI57087.1 integral membrane protein [Bordetella ansorpii]
MRGVPYALLGAAIRMAGWLNGVAALALACFSLGIVGGDVAPPDDLQVPLAWFLIGLLATGLAAVLAFLAHLGWVRRRADGRVSLRCRGALALALAAYLVALAGFGLGCWTSLTEDLPVDDGGDASPAGAFYTQVVAPAQRPFLRTGGAI